MTDPMTVLFAGGGTGGHLFPGIAVAEELLRRDASTRLIFVGSERAIESTIMTDRQWEHCTLTVEPLPLLKRNPLRFAWRNWQALRAARRLLDDVRPSVVVGLGGYASAPLVWLASRNKIPVVLLEQNVIPGRTTRWLSRWASSICVSFDETRAHLPPSCHPRVETTGNPVRAALVALHASPNKITLDDSERNRCLLILGGSQGADALNEAVMGALQQLPELATGWRFIHQTGPRQVDRVRQFYQQSHLSADVEPFFHNMGDRYSSASLAISRAGATSLAELACMGLPTIFVPYPQAADDHQRANARTFVEHGAGMIVEQDIDPQKTATALAAVLTSLLPDADRRCQMSRAARLLAHPDAAARIVDHILVLTDFAHRNSGDLT